MTLQNRVLPTGEIVAHPARGTLTGNRGILHDAQGRLGVSRWRHQNWICCTLTHPSGRYHGPMPDRGWTALFFLDEAVALAAGHRPCAECRRADYTRFRTAWERAHGPVANAAAMDRALHRARVTRTRHQVRHNAPSDDLPTGTVIVQDGHPFLVSRSRIFRFSPDAYTSKQKRPTGKVTVLTPAPLLAVFRHGYTPMIHPSAA